jgi:hypothetical protein
MQSFVITEDVMFREDISSFDKLLLSYIASFLVSKDQAGMTVPDLAKRFSVSERTIQRSLGSLRNCGLVEDIAKSTDNALDFMLKISSICPEFTGDKNVTPPDNFVVKGDNSVVSHDKNVTPPDNFVAKTVQNVNIPLKQDGLAEMPFLIIYKYIYKYIYLIINNYIMCKKLCTSPTAQKLSNKKMAVSDKKLPKSRKSRTAMTVQQILADNRHSIAEDSIKSWIDNRKMKHKVNVTPVAWRNLNAALDKYAEDGHDPCEVFDLMVDKSWQTVKHSWVANVANELSTKHLEAKKAQQRALEDTSWADGMEIFE